jgi:hypothetical protein
MTDSDLLRVTLEAVLALAERLTGERLTITAETAEGPVGIIADGRLVIWESRPSRVSVASSDLIQE